jgi:hypothetical protein
VEKGNKEIVETFIRRESISIFEIRKSRLRWRIPIRDWTDVYLDVKLIKQCFVSAIPSRDKEWFAKIAPQFGNHEHDQICYECKKIKSGQAAWRVHLFER